MSPSPNVAFELRIRIPGNGAVQPAPVCTIRAYDGFLPGDIDDDGTAYIGRNPYGWTPGWDTAGRIKLTVEVRHDGVIVFPAGQLYCALHGTSDGAAAKELAMSLVAMHPSSGGGESDDYYDGYSPEQLAWCEAYGEDIDMERETRYFR